MLYILIIADASFKKGQEIFTKIMELFQSIKKHYKALDLKELIGQLNQLTITWEADLGIDLFRYLQGELW